jgi:F-type H+-transporting ATPase subunit b
MPQLDPTSFPSQLFWLAVTFIVLFLLMWRLALPGVARVLQRREEKITSDLDRAQALKSEAAEIIGAYDKALAAAREQAGAITRQAVDEMNAQAAKRTEAMSATVAQQIKAAESRIAAARGEALNQLRDVANEAASLAVAKLAGAQPPAERIDAAVRAAMTERN